MDILHSLATFFAAPEPHKPQSPAPAADSAVCMDGDMFEELKAAVAEDAAINWQELAHPRKGKGQEGGGQFAKKPETKLREDARDNLSKSEGGPSVASSVAKTIEGIVKGAAPVGTSVRSNLFTERGQTFVATKVTNNDRGGVSHSAVFKMMQALKDAGCEDVEADASDGGDRYGMTIFCSPPVDPGSAAQAYMNEVEKSTAHAIGGGSGAGDGSYKPSEEAKASAAEMAKNVDADNPAKRIRVDFQEWSYEDGLKGEPSSVGKEEDATDGKVFTDAAAAAKWLLKTKNAGQLEGDPAWYSTVTQEGGKWRTYKLTPVNFTEKEILEINRLVQKGEDD